MSPYVSDAQRRFFHTNTAKKKGITAAQVSEYDQASKGMKLPEHVSDQEGPQDQKGVSLVKHIGFDAAAEKAAKGAGVSLARGKAIIAAGARKASPAAVRKNPRLKKVSGVDAGTEKSIKAQLKGRMGK